jgi:hypothetical protein
MPTFSAPLQEKTAEVPSKCNCTCVLGMPRRTLLSGVDTVLVKKGRQQSAGKKGIYWALTKCKKGYSKIDEALWSLLVAAFNDHTHVIMLPNANDLLHLKLKNVNGKKVLVCKVLTQASLGTIFSDIIRDNPTIKGKVVERAFRYIVSGLGCVRHCEHIPTWISLSGDLAFSHQDGIYGFKFPKRFSELSRQRPHFIHFIYFIEPNHLKN